VSWLKRRHNIALHQTAARRVHFAAAGERNARPTVNCAAMVDLNRPSLQSAFQTVQRRMVALLEYASAVTPAIKDDIRHLPELADSVIVLAVSRLESFFVDVVSLGTRHRENMLRRHFAKHGQKSALYCDLPTLVKMVRRRVSFEDGGRRLDNLFRLMFGCSVWPTDSVRDLVLDLVLLRNFIVHSSGQDWSHEGVVPADYAAQFSRGDLLSVRRYGTYAVYSVDSHRALLFMREAMLGLVEQLKYLEQRLVHDMSWAEPAP
jgi:hypothetical protein